MRIGEGWDVHALVPGRPLVIGGVAIPYDRGLLGHSDADVLLHAITDALLGAAGLGDIGRHFPDTDPNFKGADSVLLLEEAARRVGQAGWAIDNIDSTVVAQAPAAGPAHRRHARAHREGARAAGGAGEREGQDGREARAGGAGPEHRGPGRGAAGGAAGPAARG